MNGKILGLCVALLLCLNRIVNMIGSSLCRRRSFGDNVLGYITIYTECLNVLLCIYDLLPGHLTGVYLSNGFPFMCGFCLSFALAFQIIFSIPCCASPSFTITFSTHSHPIDLPAPRNANPRSGGVYFCQSSCRN